MAVTKTTSSQIFDARSKQYRYVFNLGDGNDRIADSQGSNTLEFGSGLTESDLEADRVGDDMVIHVLGTEDFVTLEDWFNQSAGDGVEAIQFADGSLLDRTGIERLMNRPPWPGPTW